jgi:hypothetical protein
MSPTNEPFEISTAGGLLKSTIELDSKVKEPQVVSSPSPV